MGHLTAPLLQPRVVADMIGLSPASLRRWDAALLPGADRRPRRYSWAEVEILQRAVHQASGRGGTPAAFQGMRAVPSPRAGGASLALGLGREPKTPAGPDAAGGPVPDRARGRARATGRRRRARRSIVIVGLPRSARRRTAPMDGLAGHGGRHSRRERRAP